MDRTTHARHRLRWLVPVVVAMALFQWALPAADVGAGTDGGAPAGTQVALTHAAPDGVTVSRSPARLLAAQAPAPGADEHGPEPGLLPGTIATPSLALLGVAHAAHPAAVWDPHPPTARDRAPPR